MNAESAVMLKVGVILGGALVMLIAALYSAKLSIKHPESEQDIEAMRKRGW